MNVFAELRWNNLTSTSFVDDNYIRENTMTYKLLNDKLKVPKWKHNADVDEIASDDNGADCDKATGKQIAQDNDGDEMPEEEPPLKKRKQWIAGLVAGLPFPKHSTLSKDEQLLYIQLHAKFMHKKLTLACNVSVNDQKEFCQYVDLNTMVTEERGEFLQFLKKNWGVQVYKHSRLPTEVEHYTSEAWRQRLEKRLSPYKQCYNKLRSLPLVYQGDHSKIQLVAGVVLLQMGTIPYIINPTFQNKVQIPQDSVRVSQRYPPDGQNADEDVTDNIYKVPVSRDPNAARMALAHDVNVVISSGGLKAICNNHSDFGNSWDIPVIVREHKSEDSAKKKIVYIDKRLPRRSFNIVERNTWFHKLGVRTKWCHPKHLCAQKFRCPSSEKTAAQELFNCLKQPQTVEGVGADVENHSTKSDPTTEDTQHGGLVEAKPTSKPQQIARRKAMASTSQSSSASSDDAEEKDNLCIDTDNNDSEDGSESPIRKPIIRRLSSRGQFNKRHSESDRQSIESDSKDISNSLSGIGGVASRQASQRWSRPHPLDNVSYQLWTLKMQEPGKEELCRHMMKQSSGVANREIKLLVRTRCDGILKPPQNKKSTVPSCVLPKLEYQSEFGAEKMTKAELANEWVSLNFRQNSILTRVRVNAETSEALLLENRSLEELTQDAKVAYGPGFIAEVKATLYNILCSLTDLPVGDYLLSHTRAMQAFALLLEGNAEFGSVNLKDIYTSVKPDQVTKPDEMPWIEVDTSVMMPYHVAFGRVSGTFHPHKNNTKPKPIPDDKPTEPTRTKKSNFLQEFKHSKNRRKKKKRKKTQLASSCKN